MFARPQIKNPVVFDKGLYLLNYFSYFQIVNFCVHQCDKLFFIQIFIPFQVSAFDHSLAQVVKIQPGVSAYVPLKIEKNKIVVQLYRGTMTIIEQMLAKYAIDTENDLINALKEIFQEIVLLGLYRGNFFASAAFYGGTALRILYGSRRFSEDLDFSLIEKNPDFNIEPYFQNIIEEFEALGLHVCHHETICKQGCIRY